MILRRARPSDKETVLDFCKQTFSWGDYISEVWDNWISEGYLLVITIDEIPVGICHAIIFNEYRLVWIEGIRINPIFRRQGLARKLVMKAELLAKENGCMVSHMLIETNNNKSLSLAQNINYKKHSKWQFYSLTPKKIVSKTEIKFANYTNSMLNLIFTNSLYFVNSWRWIPLNKSNILSLIKEK